MKQILIFSLCLMQQFLANFSEILESKNIKFYADNEFAKNLGYGNWNPFEDGEYLMIKAFIKKGDTVIDAGAHIGDWSELVLAQTENNCKLYSFEPVPNFFKKLTDKLNNKAMCFNFALGIEKTEALMNYYYVESEGCSSLFDRKVLNTIPVQRIPVSLTSLDLFCAEQQIEHINFLKIDTEGSEWDVLQGADQLITERKINIIQFEYGGTYPDANITLEQVYHYLTSKNYAIFRIASDGLIHIPEWHAELENFHLSNWLAILNNL